MDDTLEFCYDCGDKLPVVECGDGEYRCEECWEIYADSQEEDMRFKRTTPEFVRRYWRDK